MTGHILALRNRCGCDKRMKDTNMAVITQVTHCELARRELLAIADARGDLVRCSAGELWLTVDGDRRDVVLPAGADWRIESDGPVVVSALQPSAFSIERRQAPVATGLPLFRLGRSFPSLALFPSPLIR
jgi:hypothetical protein